MDVIAVGRPVTPTMRAVVLDAPGPVESLQIRKSRCRRRGRGGCCIRVEAFGLNRSELHTRLGLAEGVVFPRVLGIEAVGVVDAAPAASSRPASRSPR